MSNFARCFPVENGMMLCEHFNGNWIVFPISETSFEKKGKKQKPLKKEKTLKENPLSVSQ